MPTSTIPRTATLETLDLAGLVSYDGQLPGVGNLLVAARKTLSPAASQLRSLLDQAPRLQQTLRGALQTYLQGSPDTCGLRHAGRQVTMLTFATRLLASPVFANPFANWSTWGFDEHTAQSQMTVAQWVSFLSPIVNAAKLRAPLDYWEGRMPGTVLSRSTHAQNLLGQHFTSSLDIAYGQGMLSIDSWLQGRQPSPRHARLEWRQATGGNLISTAALLIAPPSGQAQWLIYIPGTQNSVQQLANQESLRDWVFQNRSRFWSDPSSPLTPGTRDDVLVTDVQGDGFRVFIEQISRQYLAITDHYLTEASLQGETDPFDWTALHAWENERSAMVAQAVAPAVEAAIDEVIAKDTALPAEEVHFACLEQHLPTGWRQQLVEHQETLLEQYLEGAEALTSDKVSLLREGQLSLDQLQSSHDSYLLAIPEPAIGTDLQALVSEETRVEHIADGLCQALLKEARLQNTLGDLSAPHLSWVEMLVDRPEPSLQRPVQVSSLALAIADQKWQLRGYMIIRAVPMDDDDTEELSVLLYKPGVRGGLMVFDNEPALARRLLATLHGAWPDALLESAEPSGAMQILESLSGSPSVTFTHTPISEHFMRHCVQSIVAALPADCNREHVRQRLCISDNRARTMALARWAEKNRSSHTQGQLQSLRHLEASQLTALANQIVTLQEALHASAGLLSLNLPSRMHFAQATLHEHLRRELGRQTIPHISLDIADSVTLEREVTGQTAIGGAGSREVPVFSNTRSIVTLEGFMLWALDDERRHRLNNAIVRFEPAADSALQSRLTPAYLANLTEQLDIAGSYETRITQTYLGEAHESPWHVQWRRETLRAPYEIRLRLLMLSRPTSLEVDGQQLLEKFCSEQIDDVSAKTIKYQSVALQPGTAVDGSSDSVGLSAIYLIQGSTGPVLLYLPDTPDGSFISQHTSSEAACQALQDMALDRKMARYLAERSQSGDPDQHERYINTALQKNFQAFIVPGVTYAESLPTHEYRLEMGAHIRSHRATSRSQADLTLAASEVANRHVLLGLRIALGILPGVGTALALYDGWYAANAAVRAFEHGNLEEGLLHVVSLLQSLTDAMLTLAPLAATAGNPAAAARLLTQQRQRLDPLRPLPAIGKPRPSPFAGYEAELPTGPMVPSALPQGAGVFEHAATRQHFITRNGAWYAVEWDPAYLSWRLKPQGLRAYRQPVRLDESGTWDTPGRLSGLLVDNGLHGGGGVLTTLYNHGVAYWRQAFRRQPPQLTGIDLAHDINNELVRSRARLATKQADYRTAKQGVAEGAPPSESQRAAIATARRQLSDELRQDIEFNARSIKRLSEQRATLTRADYRSFTVLCEANISEMSVLDMRLAADRLKLATVQVERALAAFRALPSASAPTVLVKRLTRDLLKANQETIETLLVIERLALRHQVRRRHLQDDALTDYLKSVDQTGLTLDVENTRLVRAVFLSNTLMSESAVEHPRVEAFIEHFHEQGVAFRNTLYSHIKLPGAGLSPDKTRDFLTSVRTRYARYLSHVTAWQDNFQELLSPSETRAFRQLMRQLMNDIDAQLINPPTKPQSPNAGSGRGPSRPRLFETVEGPLIGEAILEEEPPRMHISQPHSPRTLSVYTQDEAGQWQLSAPERAAPRQALSALVDAANARLNDIARQQARLRSYQSADTIPLDLEDIAQGHAQQLRFIAESIRRKAGASITPEHAARLQDLETAAEQMDTLGRQLRIAQTKDTGKPTVGYLEYLLEQHEVEVVWSRTLRPKLGKNGKPIEYLEEYRIDDLTTRQPLWYAHFHFRRKPAQGFTRLEAGHLKLASERDLGAGAWRGSMSETQASRLFGSLRPAN
ncbi:hypothetical protein ACIPW4_01860 [Pseudomonas sp. NPDC089996]|uniref:hypothetical protein n=1 Tax=Pseudomonas sp. NPDC089996 TaxID=3364474 RepID=UPI00382E1167